MYSSLQDYFTDCRFLRAVECGPSIDSYGNIDAKRSILGIKYTRLCAPGGRVLVSQASDNRVNRAYKSVAQSVRKKLEVFDKDLKDFPMVKPVLNQLEREARASSEDVAERIAIMLDSCTELERAALTTMGAKLGDYAVANP